MPPLKLDEKFVKARRALIVWDRLHGHTLATLQKKYNLSQKQMRKEMTKAKKSGLLEGIEEKILTTLSDKALALYEKALADGDLFVAKDVLVHAAKIADRHAKKEEQQQGMSLQLWLQLRKEKQQLEENGEVIDVEPSAKAEIPQRSDVGGDGPLFTETLTTRHGKDTGELRVEIAHPLLFRGSRPANRGSGGNDDDV